MMRAGTIRTVATFEFLSTVKRKGYIIATFGMPLVPAGLRRLHLAHRRLRPQGGVEGPDLRRGGRRRRARARRRDPPRRHGVSRGDPGRPGDGRADRGTRPRPVVLRELRLPALRRRRLREGGPDRRRDPWDLRLAGGLPRIGFDRGLPARGPRLPGVGVEGRAAQSAARPAARGQGLGRGGRPRSPAHRRHGGVDGHERRRHREASDRCGDREVRRAARLRGPDVRLVDDQRGLPAAGYRHREGEPRHRGPAVLGQARRAARREAAGPGCCRRSCR